MSIITNKITDKEANQLLNKEESQFFDYKDKEIKPAKLTRTLVAFANSDGGELLIGVRQVQAKTKQSWHGFSSLEDANSCIAAFDEIFPLNEGCTYSFVVCDAYPGYLLNVVVSKTRDIKKTQDGKVYIRRNAQNLPVNTDEKLRQLERNKGITTFENETVDFSIDLIVASFVMKEFSNEIIPRSKPEVWLKMQQCIYKGKPTVGGLLLFSDEPQATLPKRCGIKIYRYKTSVSPGTRETLAFVPITIEGCIYDQIKDAVDKTKSLVQEIPSLGNTGLESITYPTETLHEIITNAVIHRDYSITDDVHVRIFDNKVEVESPGTLPGHITEKNILDERYARNPSIVRLINKFPNPPNKDIGEGLNTAFSAMRNLRLKEPTIQQKPNSVLVIIRHEPLASNEEIIMEYLNNHEEIKNSKARELCYVGSENSMKRVLQGMVEIGLIEPTGKKGKAYSYRKVKE